MLSSHYVKLCPSWKNMSVIIGVILTLLLLSDVNVNASSSPRGCFPNCLHRLNHGSDATRVGENVYKNRL